MNASKPVIEPDVSIDRIAKMMDGDVVEEVTHDTRLWYKPLKSMYLAITNPLVQIGIAISLLASSGVTYYRLDGMEKRIENLETKFNKAMDFIILTNLRELEKSIRETRSEVIRERLVDKIQQFETARELLYGQGKVPPKPYFMELTITHPN